MRKRNWPPAMKTRTANQVLAQLTDADYERLKPDMKTVTLDYKQSVIEPNERIDHVFFVESGVVSLVTDLKEGGIIESGTVGNESFVGTSVVLGVERSASRCFVQIPGRAIRLPSAVVLTERKRGGPFAETMLRVTHATMAMLSQCVACNRAHAVEQRMSRWLLMTHDRVDGDTFPLTQEFLAQMLGVHRPAAEHFGRRPPARRPHQVQPRGDHHHRPAGSRSRRMRVLRGDSHRIRTSPGGVTRASRCDANVRTACRRRPGSQDYDWCRNSISGRARRRRGV